MCGLPFFDALFEAMFTSPPKKGQGPKDPQNWAFEDRNNGTVCLNEGEAT